MAHAEIIGVFLVDRREILRTRLRRICESDRRLNPVKIVATLPDVRCIVLSSPWDDTTVFDAIASGASAFLPRAERRCGSRRRYSRGGWR